MDTHYVAFRLASAPSTQSEARIRYSGSPVLVIADEQTEGRGRSGSSWVTAPRAVAASLMTEVSWPADRRSPIPLVAGLAALDHLPDDVSLKWPNDLVTVDGKIGGILSESDGATVVVGIGLNLWWPDPMPDAAGLFDTDPGGDAAEAFARAWAVTMLKRLESAPGEWGRDHYADRCMTIGSAVEWEPRGSGRAVAIADDGALLVDVGGDVVRLDSGVVRTIRSR